MKFTAPRTHLAAAAKWVTKAIPRTPPTPILAGMLITVTANTVTLSAFDYELSLAATTEGQPGEPGKVVVGGFAFASFLSAARGTDVTLTSAEGKLTVTAGASSATFRTMPLNEYPELPTVGAKKTLLGSLSGDVLADIVGRLLPFTSRDLTDTVLFQTTALLEGDGDQVSVTVGTRYALAKESFAANVKPFTMSAPALRLNDALADFQGVINVHDDDGALTLVTPSRTASLRLMDAKWPNVEPMLKAGTNAAEITVDRESFLASLKLCATASDRVKVEASLTDLVVSSYIPEKGESSSDIVDVLPVTSDTVGSFAVAQKYVQAIAAGATGETVTISYNPTTAKAATATDGKTRFVFMPIKMKE